MTQSPGRQLRAAREALGKTTSEMARATRITVQQINGLEADKYDCIPAPMYVRGFMKLYAQELGLAPEPLLAKYEEMRAAAGTPDPRDRAPKKNPAPTPDAEAPEESRGDDAPRDRGGVVRAVLDGLGVSPREQSRPLARIRDVFARIDLSPLFDRGWWLESKSARVLAGLCLGLLLVGLLGFCGRRGADDAPEPPPPSAQQPSDSPSDSLPEIERPLLPPPETSLPELPRTLE